jgi:hypothetical protein
MGFIFFIGLLSLLIGIGEFILRNTSRGKANIEGKGGFSGPGFIFIILGLVLMYVDQFFPIYPY